MEQRQACPAQSCDLVRPRRGAARQPAVPGARRLFQGCRCGALPSTSATTLARPATACRTTRRSAPSFTFHGKTAHGANNPWDGKDAVDAVELMDIGFDKLREHLRPTYRAHRTITIGGIQPNIIPDNGPDLVVRARRHRAGREGDLRQAHQDRRRRGADDRHDRWTRRIRRVGLAAARQQGAEPRRSSSNIERSACRNGRDEEAAFAKRIPEGRTASRRSASPRHCRSAGAAAGRRRRTTMATSPGWCRPGCMNFPASVPGIGYHDWPAAVTPTSTISHKGKVAGAKVLAASILDLMSKPELLTAARAEFDVEGKKVPYFSLLPADAQPPLDLNRAEMEEIPARDAEVLSQQASPLSVGRHRSAAGRGRHAVRARRVLLAVS